MQTLRTQRLVLEPQAERHANGTFALLSDPALYEFEGQPPASAQWLRARANARSMRLLARLGFEGSSNRKASLRELEADEVLMLTRRDSTFERAPCRAPGQFPAAVQAEGRSPNPPRR